MEKVKNTWSKKQTYEKVLSIIGTTCAISIIILAPIQILGIWNTAINIVEPLLGVLMLIQTIQNWKKSKGTAILSLLATILIFLFLIELIFDFLFLFAILQPLFKILIYYITFLYLLYILLLFFSIYFVVNVGICILFDIKKHNLFDYAI